MTTDSGQIRKKLHISGAVAGLLVWTAASGVGSLSGPAGLFLGLLTYWMLTGTLVWAVCSGETGEGESPPVDEPDGVPGWLLVVLVLALLVWIGLSGVGDMSGVAGFFLALLAIAGLSGIVIWARRGSTDDEAGDHRFAMLPDPVEPDTAPEMEPEVRVEGAAAVAQPVQADDLKQIKGIGPALETTLHEAGVTHFAQIAAWDEAAIDAMAVRLGSLGGRIRSDDWVGQARALAAPV